MINKLIALASELDDAGHIEEADKVDSMISTLSESDEELSPINEDVSSYENVGNEEVSNLNPDSLSNEELSSAASYWTDILSNAVSMGLDSSNLHDIIGHASAAVRNFSPEIKKSLGLKDTDGEQND